MSATGSGDSPGLRTGAGFLAGAAVLAGAWKLASGQPAPGALAIWGAAGALTVVILTASACKGTVAGWFHPLSLPFAAITVMSLAAPLWVLFTHRTAGLLYDPGYEPAGESPLAVALSLRACEALVLVLAGYLAGAVIALVITAPAHPAPGVRLHCRDMRRGAFRLMAAGAAGEAVVAILSRGTPYGAGQFQYGLPAALDPAATAAFLSGLLLMVTAAREGSPVSLRGLLAGRDWAAVALYVLAITLRGGRGGLIAPAVCLAWAYSVRVRPVAARQAAVAIAAALVAGAMITGYRQGGTPWPSSPAAVMQGAADSVSSPAWLTQQTVTYVPSGTPYLHGSTYLAAAEGQLPGPLSRAAGIPSRSASAVFRSIIGFTDPDQGFAESYPSEAYLDFGLPGCAAAGIFLGMLMGWAWRRCPEAVMRARDLLYPIMATGLAGGFRADALTQVKDVLYPLLAIWALMRYYRLRGSVDLTVRPLPRGLDRPGTD